MIFDKKWIYIRLFFVNITVYSIKDFFVYREYFFNIFLYFFNIFLENDIVIRSTVCYNIIGIHIIERRFLCFLNTICSF